MGKTPQQLEWADQICSHTGGDVLILAPLAVSLQTVEEAKKFGKQITLCESQDDVRPGINITNYEKLHKFDASHFVGVVLDESSCLKNFTGAMRNQVIDSFRDTHYKLACTATPAPNDYMELGNHAEFLGVMSRTEMLSMFFVHDGGDTQSWRLKGHAQESFWKWLCSWSVNITKPSQIGFSDEGYDLPEMQIQEIMVECPLTEAGLLFALPASSLDERRIARKASIGTRIAKAAQIVNNSMHQWVVWCDFNAESTGLAKAIAGAVEVTGSMTPEQKQEAMMGFASGRYRVIVTKPSIASLGLNWQFCSKMMFVGLSDSWEDFHQATRRIYRFGQLNWCDIKIVISDLEQAVLQNIKRKARDAETMADEMAKHMSEISIGDVNTSHRETAEYKTKIETGEGWEIRLGDCVEEIQKIKSDSIHFSVFSPPFSSLYTYSASDRDMGNSASDDQFLRHFGFMVKELYRIMKPGRLVAFHCMNLPTSKARDGVIGIRDFRGALIRAFEVEGWIYHSEVCIWKDPVTAMQRTKALGLLHKTIRKDSTMSRQGIPDYLVVMRKPGQNDEPVSHTHEQFPVQLWQQYASPVWMDINPSNTLQRASAREHNDERHICPLQLQVIERAVNLWTNPGDVVFSPFAGIGSEGYSSLKMGRKFLGVELKESYFKQAVLNLKSAAGARDQDLFGFGDILDETCEES